MKKRLKINNIIFTILLSLICLMIVNNVLFIHSHNVHGEIITHAHPFESDNDIPQEHNHSDSELILLNNLSILSVLVIVILSFKSNILREEYIVFKTVAVAKLKGYLYNFGNDPPFLKLYSY